MTRAARGPFDAGACRSGRTRPRSARSTYLRRAVAAIAHPSGKPGVDRCAAASSRDNRRPVRSPIDAHTRCCVVAPTSERMHRQRGDRSSRPSAGRRLLCRVKVVLHVQLSTSRNSPGVELRADVRERHRRRKISIASVEYEMTGWMTPSRVQCAARIAGFLDAARAARSRAPSRPASSLPAGRTRVECTVLRITEPVARRSSRAIVLHRDHQHGTRMHDVYSRTASPPSGNRTRSRRTSSSAPE